ncbi:MAG: hypothetical protein ACOCV1_04110 [Bacillota bacterium]
MCTRLHNNEVIIAKEDIPCFKIVKKELHRKNRYNTYFQFAHITLNEVKFADGFEIKKNYNSSRLSYPFIIEKGLHSFRSYYYAVDTLKFLEPHDTNYKILKGIIPKGSRYVKGSFFRNNDAYVSNAEMYTEVYDPQLKLEFQK